MYEVHVLWTRFIAWTKAYPCSYKVLYSLFERRIRAFKKTRLIPLLKWESLQKSIIIGEIGNVTETDSDIKKLQGRFLRDVFCGRSWSWWRRLNSLQTESTLHRTDSITVAATIESEKRNCSCLISWYCIKRICICPWIWRAYEHSKKNPYKYLQGCMDNDTREWNAIKTKLKDVLSEYIYSKTKEESYDSLLLLKKFQLYNIFLWRWLIEREELAALQANSKLL